MLRDIMQIGDKIDILQMDKNDEIKNSKILYSQLLDIVDDTLISISTPIKNGNTKMLHHGITYQLCFYTSKGLYSCKCQLEKIYRENHIIILQMRIISSMEKIQRRQYYRLECVLDFDYRLFTYEEIALEQKLISRNFKDDKEFIEIKNKLDEYDKQWVKASITDLSGGGAKFIASEQHKPEDKLRMQLLLPNRGKENKISIVAEVIASEKVMNVIERYEHRVSFVGLNSQDREVLIKFIFEQDRQRVKNVK